MSDKYPITKYEIVDDANPHAEPVVMEVSRYEYGVQIVIKSPLHPDKTLAAVDIDYFDDAVKVRAFDETKSGDEPEIVPLVDSVVDWKEPKDE